VSSTEAVVVTITVLLRKGIGIKREQGFFFQAAVLKHEADVLTNFVVYTIELVHAGAFEFS